MHANEKGPSAAPGMRPLEETPNPTRAGKGRRAPAHVLFLDTVGESSLDKEEKSILRVLERWANGDGEMWPAISTMARHASMSVRGVQKVLRRLVAKGVLLQLAPNSGGRDAHGRPRTTKYRFNMEKLVASNPERGAGLNPERENVQPRTPFVPTPNRVRFNPEPRSPEPSIHELTTRTNHEGRSPKGDAVSNAPRNGCMVRTASEEPADLKQALARAGIAGENLNKLASTDLTPGDVERERERIAVDPKVRNRSAVLARALAIRAGVELTKRKELGASLASALGQIEEMKRQRQRQHA